MATLDEATTEAEYPDKAKEGLCGIGFPDYDGAFYVPDGFIDASLVRDIVPCPSIMDDEAVLVIRQDFSAPDRRVMGDKRYRVDICREEILDAGYVHCQPILSTDDFQEAVSFAKEKLPEMKDAIEEVIADERREKILAYDNRELRNGYDDFMAKAHAIAMDMASEKPIYLHKDDCSVEAAAMMLLEKKYDRNAIYRAFKECSPLTTYPGRESELAKDILATVSKEGAERYVAPKFREYIQRQNGAAQSR